MPTDADLSTDQVTSLGVGILWTLHDGGEGELHLAAAVQATGWLGVGIGEAGGMVGSDVALFTAVEPTKAVDAHVVGERQPIEDGCQD